MQNTRVLNITRQYHVKHKQAVRAIQNCAATWVDFGKTIRDLTIAEAIAARNEEARLRDPLPMSEIRGITTRGIKDLRSEMEAARLADKWAWEQCHK